MRFLVIQIIIVILICIFFAALSNLTELGILGWVLAASTGHGLYRIYKHLHRSMKASNSKRKCISCNAKASDLSYQIQSFMFDDATVIDDE
ncbi:MAG: hypothetical protein FWD05_06930 [Oscillospiraceae bacterium]|nr:hypothetical protein [Oscillospiraceae bacterium]